MREGAVKGRGGRWREDTVGRGSKREGWLQTLQELHENVDD